MEDHATHSGVCGGSGGHLLYNWPASSTSCQFVTDQSPYDITAGLCRPLTEKALIQQDCINGIFSLPQQVQETLLGMIRSMCRREIYYFLQPRPVLECTSDCVNTLVAGGQVLYEDPMCLADCGDLLGESCLTSLLTDYSEAGGVCAGSLGDVLINWPTSSQPCQMEGTTVLTGLCSPNTLQQPGCLQQVPSTAVELLQHIYLIFISLCGPSAPAPVKNLLPARLNPVEQQTEWFTGITLNSQPRFENTRGRYPWLCSLRGRQDRKHYCGATILSRPPGPLVILTAAHCVFLCKSGESTLPNCCCENVSGAGCPPDSGVDCGAQPRGVEVMTGLDSEVVCGDWEAGNYTAEESGEEYNIILQIDSVTVHPDYKITRGTNNSQYVTADLAVLRTKTDHLTEREISELTPVCLPQSHSSEHAVQAGWSSPPSWQTFLYFTEAIQESTEAKEENFRQFFKLWHYNMTLLPCQDPQHYFSFTGPTDVNVKYPTNSYYPPGTLCATEKNHQFCPTSGESGSPLMVEDEEEGRLFVLGFNSFMKGCSSAQITANVTSQFLFVGLKQHSENPREEVKKVMENSFCVATCTAYFTLFF